MASFLKSSLLGYALICMLITVLVSGFYLEGLMFSPATHTPTFGGDGLTIQYNLQYHASYGHGTHLTSQYYPHGEVVFMTAAQGFLAYILAGLRPMFPNIGDHAMTISNILTNWSNVLSALLLFIALIRFKIRPGQAALFASFIALLAPQIVRQTCGHYSLSFSFLIPVIILYLQAQKTGIGYLLKSILLVLFLVIFGLNDPYLLAIGAAFILASALALLSVKTWRAAAAFQTILAWLLVPITALLTTLLILKGLDNDMDRVTVQYGFFQNLANLKCLLIPDFSLLGKPVSKLLSLNPSSDESTYYLGLVPVLFLICLPLLIFRKSAFLKTIFEDSTLKVMLTGSVLVLIFALGLPLSLFKEFSYEYLGTALQFRVPSRFTWVFYYMMSIVTAKFLSLILAELRDRNKNWAVAALLGISVLWLVDIGQYLSWRVDDRIHHNAFSKDKLAPIKALCAEQGINADNYHGIFLLPTEHGWTDKVYHKGAWLSNHDGYKLSLAAGLPLINGKLSRMSVSTTLASMQLISHPLIKRTYLDLISPDKDILILKAKDIELSAGELDFTAQGTLIHSNERHDLIKIKIATIKQHCSQLRLEARNSTTQALPIVYEHYEDESPVAYAGKGCREIDKGIQTILTHPIKASGEQMSLHVSLWCYVDINRYGAPNFILQSKASDAVIDNYEIAAIRAYDTQNGWVRLEQELNIIPETTELVLRSDSKFPFHIDELLIRDIKDNILHQTENKIYYNNFLIEH